MVGLQAGGAGEPEVGHACEPLALVRNRVGQDHVKGREAVGCHDQQLVITNGENIPYLALVQQRQFGDPVGLVEG